MLLGASVLSGALLLAGCGTTGYRGAAATAPPPTVPATTAPPTTAPPTTAPVTTAPSTSAATVIAGTDVRITLPAGWTVVSAGPTGTPGLDLAATTALGTLAPAGVISGTRLVATRADAGTSPAPSLVVAVTPRGVAGTTAAAALTAARTSLGTRASASELAPEPRVLVGGSYVTYRAGDVVAEHYVFERGDSLVWLLVATPASRAGVDGPAFARALLSLRAGQ